MAQKEKILFICQHNSGRSQIAEAYLKKIAGDQFEVESAGLQPASRVNPLVVEVMKEEGLDLSMKQPQSVFDLFKSGRVYSHVVTVCDDSESRCPVFPGITKRLHFPFPDPAEVSGSQEEMRRKVRDIRDQIKNWLLHQGMDTFASS